MHYVYLRHHGKGIPGNQLVGDPADEQICKLVRQGIIKPEEGHEAPAAAPEASEPEPAAEPEPEAPAEPAEEPEAEPAKKKTRKKK